MTEQEYQLRLTALDVMGAVLHIHEYYFPAGEKWSKECQEAIEGLRIANKCQALIAHDRALTTPSNLCHTEPY